MSTKTPTKMPMKGVLYSFEPTQLYIVLAMSICYFIVQLALSHITHALTLLMASYHMLSNIFALAGSILTIKHSKNQNNPDDCHLTNAIGGSQSTIVSDYSSSIDCNTKAKNVVLNLENDTGGKSTSPGNVASRRPHKSHSRHGLKLRNTFGWTRIDILSMLIVGIILISLSFFLLVEALQTLVHIDHQDTMHLPIPTMILGFVGLILNGATYLLIGGYTMHQGSFLHVTRNGAMILDRTMSPVNGEASLKPDEQQLSKTKSSSDDQQLKYDLQAEGIESYQKQKTRQGGVEMLRDVSSTLFVIVCALIVYMAEDETHTAKFIDPILSIFSCVLLVSLSYPYMKESCLILLQTIPDTINMEIFEKTLVSKFPEIVSYHDLHIWQLTAHKYIATIHINFKSPKLYHKIIADVRSYFSDQGITEVTIQPEFQSSPSGPPSLECLMPCTAPECAEKMCCRDSSSDSQEIPTVTVIESCPCGTKGHHHHTHSQKQKKHHYKHDELNQLKIADLIRMIKSKSTSDLAEKKTDFSRDPDGGKAEGECQQKSTSDIPDKPIEFTQEPDGGKDEGECQKPKLNGDLKKTDSECHNIEDKITSDSDADKAPEEVIVKTTTDNSTIDSDQKANEEI